MEWERTFDAVPDMIAILDQEPAIVRINMALALRVGITKETAIGMKIRHGPDDDHAPTGSIHLPGINSGLGIISEEIYDHDLGCFFYVTVTPLCGRDGSISGSVYVGRDVSGQKHADEATRAIQAKLIQTNKMTSLGLMVSGLSHEVNNPNNNIKLAAHLLAKSWQDILPLLESHFREEGDFRIGGQWFSQAKEILPSHIVRINENSRRIESILCNLRDFARKGAADLHCRTDINNIVTLASSIINVQIKQHTRNFKLRLQENIPLIRGNPQQLEQVVINLIMNALHALSDKSRKVLIITKFEPNGNYVIIKVIDEGKGMPPEVKNRVCEPFFSTRLEQGGTGLGLAIANFIVREHKGCLEFESSTGSGTTVSIKLPVQSVPENQTFR